MEAEVCISRDSWIPRLPARGWLGGRCQCPGSRRCWHLGRHRALAAACEPGSKEALDPSPPATPWTSSSPCPCLPGRPLSIVPMPWAQGGSAGAIPTGSPPSCRDSTRGEDRCRATALMTLFFPLSPSGQISVVEQITESHKREVFFLCFLFLPLCLSRLAPFHPPSTSLCCR